MGNLLIKNIKGLVGILPAKTGPLKGKDLGKLEILEDAFLAVEDGKISMFGKMSDLSGITDWTNLEIIDADGKYVLPAYCDSHSHLVFAKTREEEFVDRIKGLSYEAHF